MRVLSNKARRCLVHSDNDVSDAVPFGHFEDDESVRDAYTRRQTNDQTKVTPFVTGLPQHSVGLAFSKREAFHMGAELAVCQGSPDGEIVT